MKRSLTNIHHELKDASNRIQDFANFQESLIRICAWVIEAHDNPATTPQTLEYQINQLKEHLNKDT